MSKQVYESYQTKTKSVLVAKVTRRNMKKISKWIGERLDVGQCSIICEEICFTSTGLYHIASPGAYVVMDADRVRVMSKRQLESIYRKEYHPITPYYTPTENQVKVIKALDGELYWGYDYICSETDLERSEAKEAITTLRLIGVVDFARGLMNDDGEVGGSGFAILDRLKAEALLYRYYGDNDDR